MFTIEEGFIVSSQIAVMVEDTGRIISKNSAHSRLLFVDIAKGILITCLVLYHIENYISISWCLGMPDNIVAMWLRKICVLPVSFFMPAFFLISGFCSSFDTPFNIFFKKQLKILILPSVTLKFISVWIAPIFDVQKTFTLGYTVPFSLLKGGDWFLTSLFVTKLILWFLVNKKVCSTKIFLASLLMFFVGSTIHLLGYDLDFWWIRQILLLFIFVAIGYFLKSNYEKVKQIRIFIFIGIIFLLSFIISIALYGNVPSITRTIVLSDFIAPILVLLTGTFGSIFFLELCDRYLTGLPFVEQLGRYSLIIYMLHVPIRDGFLNVLKPILLENDKQSSLICVVITAVAIMVICYLFAILLNHKKLKWIVGKF